MGRRPKVWNYDSYACHRYSGVKNKVATNGFTKFDIEKLELLPFKERVLTGVKMGGYDNKITRFLESRVGRDYDEVYSELCQQVPHRYKYDVFGTPWNHYRMPRSFHPTTCFWEIASSGFGVDLETRTLCWNARESKSKTRSETVYQPFEVIRFTTKNYAIQQLLTEKDFAKEGEQMQHCVRTYFKRCHYVSDKISIWSLCDRLDKLLTIELNDKMIVQVRGFRNRPANTLEIIWVKDWAGRLGLGLSCNVF
jgi:PcfJ-like protein